MHNPEYVFELAQAFANVSGRPQAVVRDNNSKVYCIVEACSRNAKPSKVPANKRRPGGFVKSKYSYYPESRIGGRIAWPKG
jgi:hypothetical protein